MTWKVLFSLFLVFAMLGMLSPASRGALMTAAIFLYVFMGLIAGYHSGRLYKSMKGKEWKKAAFLVIISRFKTSSVEHNFNFCPFLDCNSLSWCYGFDRLLPQFFHLGQTQQWSSSFCDNVIVALPLALYLLSTRLFGLLLWLQKGSLWPASEN